MLLGFTVRLMYTNNMFSCLYNLIETKIRGRFGELVFVYFLLGAFTLQAGTAQYDTSIVHKHQLGE